MRNLKVSRFSVLPMGVHKIFAFLVAYFSVYVSLSPQCVTLLAIFHILHRILINHFEFHAALNQGELKLAGLQTLSIYGMQDKQ